MQWKPMGLYARLIGDGNIIIHKKLIESLTCGPGFLLNREVRSDKTYLRLRSGITKAIQHRKSDGLPRKVSCEQLRKEILNVSYHVFVDHTHCPERGYFCNGPKPEESNEVPAMKETAIFTEIQSVLNRVVHHTNRLIENVDNCVEQFNSLVAKTIGGKRINFSMRQ
ncbi:hypothetical protein PR048_002795 [Dryococelus australis]|uniref:Uncharacterized protein n=1 Tax=Dryococelus australis TaxID=614101 RepID=A0ABQ9ILB9_9NEOP|nr:hypothetical protein PR048_002795 [Dryococelus australis]